MDSNVVPVMKGTLKITKADGTVHEIEVEPEAMNISFFEMLFGRREKGGTE